MSELLSLSLPLSAERQLDVVFVHGLGGDPITTWRSGTHEDTSWPHWLSSEFRALIGVWSLGYAAASTRIRGIKAAFFGSEDPDAGAAMSLPRRAENALDRLVSSGIGKRPVCFITHSLGGLLVKNILRRSADSLNAPERLQVVQQCRGVLFLATPHHGARLANLAEAIQFYFPTVSAMDLKDNDDYLMDLYEWYREYAPAHNILTRSYYENKQVRGVLNVVSRSSADPGVAGESARGPIPLDRDHLEISKPRNRDDQAYIGSLELIRQIITSAKQEAALIHASASGASGAASNKDTIESNVATKPILDLVIGESRTIEQALEVVRIINSQMNPEKKARLIYIEEGSTHLYIDGPEDTLRFILEHYRSGALQKMFTGQGAPEKLTFSSADLIYNKESLGKASLIEKILNNKIQFVGYANLSGANLSGANLSKAHLRRANFNKAYLSGANLSQADLREADLREAFLYQTDLKYADLRMAILDSALLDAAILNNAKLNQAFLNHAKLRKADLHWANLSGAMLHEADLNSADLRSASLIKALLSYADLGGATLIKADLFRAKLKEANLSGADLSGANLHQAFLDAANLRGAELRGANLSDASLSGGSLFQASLCEANLGRTNLSGVNLSGANLKKANLSGANLDGACLIGADLSDADLSEAIFYQADLFEACVSGAKLVKTDFTQAKLESSKFGRNEGLAKSQILDMQRRGALFEDSPESDVPSLVR
jgi:uncharacterized protein YjbI with pentapeptide repeats